MQQQYASIINGMNEKLQFELNLQIWGCGDEQKRPNWGYNSHYYWTTYESLDELHCWSYKSLILAEMLKPDLWCVSSRPSTGVQNYSIAMINCTLYSTGSRMCITCFICSACALFLFLASTRAPDRFCPDFCETCNHNPLTVPFKNLPQLLVFAPVDILSNMQPVHMDLHLQFLEVVHAGIATSPRPHPLQEVVYEAVWKWRESLWNIEL